MKKLALITALIFALTGCGKSEEVVKESEGSTEVDVAQNQEENKNTADETMSQEEIQKVEIKENVHKELDRVKEATAEFKKIIEAGEVPVPELQQAAQQLEMNWSTALQTLSSLINTTLEESQKQELSKEMTEWNTSLQAKAEEEVSQYKDTETYGVQLLSSLARLNEEKTYEIVDKYVQ
ncbi:hypothetical protein DOE78_04055 [Bacillus sp. Y1]|nr:hypothetical protein [Bacillus sp. Y1]AYA74694.1 hypothetical protein DOE78_04055 [Bacillus sp. Y1]